MITLITPSQVQSILGGSTPIAYNKLVLSPLTLDPVAKTALITVRITSTAAPDMQPIIGALDITGNVLKIEVPQLDFYRRLILTVGQVNTFVAWLEAAQKQFEDGVGVLGVIAGVRSAGV